MNFINFIDDQKDWYMEEGSFWVPPQSRYEYLLNDAHQNVGDFLNKALAGLETGPVFIHSTLPDGLHAALASPLPALAAGSLFLLGDLKALLRHAEKRSTAQ